jgi:CHASE3 domain sensor protein
MKENSLKGLILSDNRSGLDTLQAARDEFTDIVEEMGIEVKQLNYGLDVKLNRPYATIPVAAGEQGVAGDQGEEEQNNSSVSTETLYNLAKIMLTQINYIERRSTNEN